jgi:CMP-N-acetylneuraminic acid synthetase
VSNIDELRGLKDAYQGRKAFILATGPSLAYKDLSFLANEVTIALNLAPLMCDQWGFEPTFHMVGDRFVYPRFSSVFEQLTRGTRTKKIVVAAACETFPRHLADQNTFFSPRMLPQHVVKFAKDPIEEGFWRGKTVVYFALQFAYFLGFSTVYILGMDLSVQHEWGTDAHCYELRRNPRFPDLEFPRADTPYVHRGWPGNPDVRNDITAFLLEARRVFESAARSLVNDVRSHTDALEQEDIIRRFGGSPHVVAFVPVDHVDLGGRIDALRELRGQPVFLHVLDALQSCHAVDDVYIDTGSEEVARLAKGLKRIRPPKEVPDSAHQRLRCEASQVPDADIYVHARPTGPLLRPRTIDRVIFAITHSSQHASAVAVTERNNAAPIPVDAGFAPTAADAVSLYVCRRQALFDSTSHIGRTPMFYPVPRAEAFIVDSDDDFETAEALATRSSDVAADAE